MAGNTRDLRVRFIGETKGIDDVRGKFSAVATSVGAIGTAMAAIGGISFLKSSIDEAREAAKVTKQTEAVIKSTGSSAKVTAGHISALAERLSVMAGVDDELVQSGQNILLTFTKVRNEVGKGNDVFDQATLAALNVSAALGKDLQSSVTMIGKALNDPIAGLTAMSKAGIQFTTQQKDQIKTLVKSGNTLGAQKIILKELETQFGGMAAASADAGTKAKVAWDNLKESLGNHLLPAFTLVATKLTAVVIPALAHYVEIGATVSSMIRDEMVPRLRDMAHWMDRNQQIMFAIGGAVAAISAVKTAITLAAGATALWNGALAINPVILLIGAIGALAGAFYYAWKNSESFRNFVTNAIQKVGQAATWLWTNAIKPAFDAISKAAMWLWTNAIKPAFDAIAKAAQWLWTNVLQPVFGLIGKIMNDVGRIATELWRSLIKPAFEAIADIAKWLWSVLQPVFQAIWMGLQFIGGVVSWLWTVIVAPILGMIGRLFLWLYDNVIRVVVDLIVASIRTLGAVFQFVWQLMIKPVLDALSWAVNNLWTFVLQPVFQAIGFGFRLLGDGIKWVFDTIIRPVWQALGDAIGWVWRSLIEPVFNALKVAIGAVGDAFKAVVSFIGDVWQTLGDIIKAPINFAIDIINNGVIDPFNEVMKNFGGGKVQLKRIGYVGQGRAAGAGGGFGAIGGGSAGQPIAGRRDGGWMSGPGGPRGDKIPAWLSNDEFVVNARSAKTFAPLLEWINAPRYADGGPVSALLGGFGSMFSGARDRSKLSGYGATTDLLNGAIDKIVEGATSKVSSTSQEMSASSGGGGGNVQRWAGLVLEVLAMLGQPASLLPNVLRRMNQESGGNPNAINLWDSNAMKGTPSIGLMQTIGPTFNAHAGPFRGLGIYNPLANIYAGLHYAIGRYPSLQYAMDKPGGYWAGGEVPGPRGKARQIIAHGGEVITSASDVDRARRGQVGQTVVNNFHLGIVNAKNTRVDLKEQFDAMAAEAGVRV